MGKDYEMVDGEKIFKALKLGKVTGLGCTLTSAECDYLIAHDDALTQYIILLENDQLMKQRIVELEARIAELENANKYWFSRAAVEEKQRWIPVSEMLPEIDKEVLIYDGYREMVVGWLEGFHRYKYFRFRDERWHGEVTHWMPLPESPNDTQKETFVYGKEREE